MLDYFLLAFFLHAQVRNCSNDVTEYLFILEKFKKNLDKAFLDEVNQNFFVFTQVADNFYQVSGEFWVNWILETVHDG